ncbi:hypothetical protein GT028_25805 [Streptomyces sp. SID2999]|nr:hypothetical protein [Streptomyces sp. SID2999]MYZ10748.1 hypothetical protein [Streptomyces sp. SID2999]
MQFIGERPHDRPPGPGVNPLAYQLSGQYLCAAAAKSLGQNPSQELWN